MLGGVAEDIDNCNKVAEFKQFKRIGMQKKVTPEKCNLNLFSANYIRVTVMFNLLVFVGCIAFVIIQDLKIGK